MSTSVRSAAQHNPQQLQRCTVCGGSGQLRVGPAQFRTCLHCAGSGEQLSAAVLSSAARDLR